MGNVVSTTHAEVTWNARTHLLGSVRTGSVSAALPSPSTSTRMSEKEEMNFFTGSVRETRPCSTSCMTAIEVIIFVSE